MQDKHTNKMVEARKEMLRKDEGKVEELLPELTDTAIPILPSRSVNDTLAFFSRLGFDGKVWGEPYSYAILRRGTVELHFFAQEDIRPAESSAGCYIRVSNVENIYQTFALAQLPRKGIPRQDALEDKPWGMREFAIVDPDGNLLRIGQPL